MSTLERLRSSEDPVANRVAAVLQRAFERPAKKRESLAMALAECIVRPRRVPFVDEPPLLPIARDVIDALVEMWRDDNLVDRPGVLDALHRLAVADDRQGEIAHPYDDAWDAFIAADGTTLRTLRAPIIALLPSLLTTLRDNDDAAVRREIARLCAVFPQQRTEIVAALDAALATERDPLARYAILYSLARHGSPRTVPTPDKKDPVLSIAERFVRIASGEGLAGAGQLMGDATKIGGLGNITPGFPGDDVAMRAIPAAIVADAMRRNDPGSLKPLANGLIADFVLRALAPHTPAPVEPLAKLSDTARTWIAAVMFAPPGKAATLPLPPSDLALHGFASNVHVRRLLGLERGASDVEVEPGVPAWLLARRVCDERAPLARWLAAMDGRSPEDVIAIVSDLEPLGVHEPWPAPRMPLPTSADLDANAQYFALVRATFAKLPTASIEPILDIARSPLRAAALASLVVRGVEVPATRDTLLAELLEPFSLAHAEMFWDAASLRTVLDSLPTPRRDAALAVVAAGFAPRLAAWPPRAIGLWRFADIAPLPLLPKLIDDLVRLENVAKPKTPYEHDSKRMYFDEIVRAARVGGSRFAPLVRDALAAAKKAPVKELLSAALAGAEGREFDGDAVTEQSAPVAKVKAAKAAAKRSAKK